MRPLLLLSSLALSGAERVTVSFARRLAERAEETEPIQPVEPPVVATVSSVCDEGLTAELDDACIVRRDLGARRLRDPWAFERYLRLLAREGFDLVHAHGQDASILASFARRFSGIPYVVTRHVLDEPASNWRQALRARASLNAARRADALIAVSAATAERLACTARIPRGQIEVVRNGIDVERFRTPRRGLERRVLRESIGATESDTVVLMPAALRDGKGHDILIEALPRIFEHVSHVRIAFAGGGERQAELSERCARFGRKVCFLGWRRDMPALMAASDIVVLPSSSEALPTVLMEAAAAGRPVVATSVGGVPEVVTDRETGVLVEPANPIALADALVVLAVHSARARALGKEARRRAEQQFSLDVQVDRTLDVWSRVRKRARERAA